jgi:hypothetical protein
MILANVRQHLTRDDAQLALRLIARGASDVIEEAETTLREQGFDALLDDPRLLGGLMASRQGAHASLPLFAYVIVRHALRDVGESDRMLADYVASILLHFGLGGRAVRVGDSDDEVYTTLAELSGAIESADAQRSFLVRAHLGNYALWMSGVFPDYIETRRWRKGGPDLDYYEEMGRRGFTLAADHRLAAQHGLSALFVAAAARFPVLRQALNNVSDALLFPHHHSPEKLMRQVRMEGKWLLS